ncbi:hypothetical protein B4O85_02730, partial [Pseudomonas azotoformans]
ASAKVICFIGKLGGWGRGILPNQKVFFRVSLAVTAGMDMYTIQLYRLSGRLRRQASSHS